MDTKLKSFLTEDDDQQKMLSQLLTSELKKEVWKCVTKINQSIQRSKLPPDLVDDVKIDLMNYFEDKIQ